jgi:hypothetical protein
MFYQEKSGTPGPDMVSTITGEHIMIDLERCWDANLPKDFAFASVVSATGLPDGLFSNQKFQFW